MQLQCAVQSNSTDDGWCQDGSPCPCFPCSELRLRWLYAYVASLDTIHDRFAVRFNSLIADHRALRNCVDAVRKQVIMLEQERDEALRGNGKSVRPIDSKEIQSLKDELERKKNLLDHVYDMLEPVGDLMIDIEQELR